MDVLKPDSLIIDRIRYRVNPGNYGSFSEKSDEPYTEQYDDTPTCEVISEGEEDIEEADGGRYSCSFHIAKIYFPYIIGSKGATKKRLETETRSKILIPKLCQDGDIVITAATRRSVASARRRIRMMVLSCRKRQAITHFLSMPINQPSIVKGFENFKDEVLQKCGHDQGINENIFLDSKQLHLTISVLVLGDEVERNEASAVLQDSKEEVISTLLQGSKLRISMSGIEIMNDDPSKVDVLYAKVTCCDNEFLLQEIADGVNSFFAKKGLLVQNKDSVKLHATLINSKYGSKLNTTGSSRESFDATNILKHFKDYYFGDGIITTIELSSIYQTTNPSSGYYRATSFITIP